MLITASEILQKSFRLYKENFRTFLPYLFLLFLPTFVFSIMGFAFEAVGGSDSTSYLIVFIILFVVVAIAAIITSLWFSIVFFRAVAFRYQGKPLPEMTQELHSTKMLIWPAIASSILASLAILGGLLLLVIPGIIFAVWFSFILTAIAIDQTKTMESLRLSKSLVHGRWWAVLWRLLAPAFVYFIFIFLAGIIVTIIMSFVIAQVADNTALAVIVSILFSVISTAINLLFTPLTTAAPTILYLELRKTPVLTSSAQPKAA